MVYGDFEFSTVVVTAWEMDDMRLDACWDRSCPVTWCRRDAPEQRWLRGQAATAGRLTVAVSLTEPSVSRLM